MNILLYTNSFLPVIGGREIVVHYLARELQELGHRIRVVGPAGWIKHRHCRFGYPVHRWPTLRGVFEEQVALGQFLLDMAIWGCDIVHAHSTYPCGYIAAKALGKRKIPLVVTPHGEDIHVAPEIGFGLRLDPVLDGKIKMALARSQIVTAISESVKESILSAGVDGGNVRLIANGIDVGRFKAHYPAVHPWLDVPENARLILTVGNYHPRKGHEDLIKAMPRVLDAFPDARCIIVGRKTGRLIPLINELGLSDHVRLTGLLTFPVAGMGAQGNSDGADRIAGLYRHSAVYVSAAKDEGAEGLSLAMLDAMAAGLPIVASRVSGNRDLVVDGINGFLVSPGRHEELAEAINACLSDPDKARALGRKGSERAEAFSWRRIAGRYVDVYREATQLAGKPASA